MEYMDETTLAPVSYTHLKPYSMWGVDGTLGNNGKPTQRAFKRYMEAAQALSLIHI